MPSDLVDIASVLVESYPDLTEGFAFCLSEEGDLLSQWRSYGRDGTGIAIGFSPEVLTKDFGEVNFGARFFELVKVGYGEDELRAQVKDLADKVGEEFKNSVAFVKLRDGISKEKALRLLADRQNQEKIFNGIIQEAPILLNQLMKILSPLHFQIYKTKPVHFHEEREWRLIRHRHKAALPDVEYFADEQSIRPFITSLIADPAKDAIQEIILGPKNRTNMDWMRACLSSVGLPHARVRRSVIESYR